jgi:hypothetical protein
MYRGIALQVQYSVPFLRPCSMYRGSPQHSTGTEYHSIFSDLVHIQKTPSTGTVQHSVPFTHTWFNEQKEPILSTVQPASLPQTRFRVCTFM